MEEQPNPPRNEESQKKEDSKVKSESRFSIEERNDNYPLIATNKIQPSNTINTIMVILLCIGIVSLLGGGMYLYMLKQGQNTPQHNTSTSQSTIPSDTSSNTNNSIQDIDLVALSPFTGTANASRMIQDGKFTLTINLSTSPATEGKYYEGWINNNSLDPSYISVGRLEKTGDQYVLNYTSTSNYTNYNTVYITEQSESASSDIRLGAHMFQGSF